MEKVVIIIDRKTYNEKFMIYEYSSAFKLQI